MKKIKLFTHTDLDGVGCSILAKLIFGKDNVNVSYCNYDNINKEVEEFYIGSEKFQYQQVFITDISISEEVANIIESYYKDDVYKNIKLLDHHQTALELNKYNWCEVTTEYRDGSKASGTSLLFDELSNNFFGLSMTDRARDFVELVRRYDTWEWYNIYNDTKAKQLNDLLYILGRDRFIEQIIDIIKNQDSFEFSDSHKLLLELRQEEIDRYIESRSKQIIESEIQGYKAGVVFGEQFHSELGNKLSELNPHLDFIVIINMDSSISYRTNKNDINLGKDIAKIYGGGGHPKASGSPISDEFRKELIERLFI